MTKVNWGGVLVGAAAGLGIAAAIAIALFTLGIRPGDSTAEDAVFILVQFFGQLAAGFVGGRFGGTAEAYHGALAALAMFGVIALISSAGGSSLGPVLLLTSGVVALVLGSAGGVLGARR